MTEENNTIITFRQQLSDVFSRSGLPQLIGEEQKTFDGIDKLEKEGGRGVLDSFGSCYDYKMAGGTPDDDRDGMGDDFSDNAYNEFNKCLPFLKERLSSIEQNEKEIVRQAINKNEDELSAQELGVIGDELAFMGSVGLAGQFYRRAEDAIDTKSGQYWHKLLQLRLLSPRLLPTKTDEIADIYEYSKYVVESMPRSDDGQDSEKYHFSKGIEFKDAINGGSRAEWLMVYAMAWQLHYDSQWFKSGLDEESINKLEGERHEFALARLNYDIPVSQPEAGLHLENFARVVEAKTVRYGGIERALRKGSIKEADGVHRQLWQDSQMIDELVRPFVANIREDPFGEVRSEIERKLWFDSFVRMDLPASARQNLVSRIQPQYSQMQSFQTWLGGLKKDIPHWFDENGELRPEIDVSGEEVGKEAASKTRSQYYFSNNLWREAGIPAGSAALGAFVCSRGGPPLMALCGAAGGLLGASGNTVYNVAQNQRQYQEALKVGLSQITLGEKKANSTMLGMSLAFTTLASAWNGPVVVNLGRKFAFGLLKNPFYVRGAISAGIRKRAHLFIASLRRFPTMLATKWQNFNFNQLEPWDKARFFLNTSAAGCIGIDQFLPYAEQDPSKRGAIFHTWVGGLGGAILINQLGATGLRVNYWGSLVSTMFKFVNEWITQAILHVPLSQPNPWRLAVASSESVVTTFMAKTTMLGDKFLKGSPVGRVTLKAHAGLTSGKGIFSRIGRFLFTPVIRRGDRTELSSKSSVKIKSINGEKAIEIKPLYVKKIRIGGYKVRNVEELNNLLANLPSRKVRKLTDELNRRGITAGEDGRLYQPKYREGGLVPINRMHEYQPWGFWGRWLKIPTKKIPKRQIDVEEETVPLNHPLRLDAMEIPVLIGRDGMPRPLWGGIPINATYVLAGVALSNLLFFGNMMFADTKNKTMKELCNWGAALFGTHPFFQWPMGYDTPVARAGGYSIGAALNVFLTKWWNPYLDWPGSVSFFESLNEGKLNDAFEILADLPLFSFVQGAEDGHFQEWDEKLVRSFRDKMDDLVKDVIVEYSKSPGMGEKYHIIANFFKMFEAKLAEYDGLSDGEKETVRLMATYIKASAEEYKVNGFGRVLKRVVEAHKEFFEGIPSVSFDDEKWDKFVEELNGGG